MQASGRDKMTTYREEEVARSICSSSGDAEENQPAIVEDGSDTICAQKIQNVEKPRERRDYTVKVEAPGSPQ